MREVVEVDESRTGARQWRLHVRGSLLGALALALSAPLGAGQCESTELFASDPGGRDNFGSRVSIHADRLLVGAPDEDAAGPQSGSAYVFELREGLWTEVAKLVASDGAAGHNMGSSVSIHGDHAVVGAHRATGVDHLTGAAYVFERTAGGWVEVAKLFAPDGAVGNCFGSSVAIHGDRLIVGAIRDSELGFSAGAAYVYERLGGSWMRVAKLLASDSTGSQVFGSSVAIHGSTALVGAPQHDGAFFSDGAAYVFERSPLGTWGPNETVKLAASAPDVNEKFGSAVALFESTALIGARIWNQSGAAYAFERDDTGTWTERARLTASDGAALHLFGLAIALQGATAVVGASGHNGGTGAIYFFERSPCGDWPAHETGRVVPPGSKPGDAVGFSVALYGTLAVAGAPGNDEAGAGPDSGSVHLLSPTVGVSRCWGLSGCPCLNPGGAAEGCRNSSGRGATLCATGSSSACADDLRVHGKGFLPAQPALLFAGQESANGGAGVPFGDGLRCAGTGLVRLGIGTPDGSGAVSFGPGLGGLGNWPPGATRHFQCWYRDPAGPCASGFNLSNSIEIAFAL